MKDPFKWIFNGGLDYANGYMHHGYLHQDSGVVLQPYGTVGGVWYAPHDLVVSPYLTIFDSIDLDHPNTPLQSTTAVHHHGEHVGAVTGQGSLTGTVADVYQGELMAGVLTRYHGLSLDLNYTFYAYNQGPFFPMQEIGAKLSYDTAPLWQEPTLESSIGLKPFFAVYRETLNLYDRQSTYGETGIEPWYRGQLWGRKVGVSFPTIFGMSLDHYFIDADGRNEFAGFVSIGAVASIELPAISKSCSWYFTSSARYYHLLADGLKAVDGLSDTAIAKVGIAFVF